CDSELRGPFQVDDVTNEADPELTAVQTFFDQTNVLITGATGFLGKVLVAKLLRACPTIGTLYLLVRPKKGKNPDERLDEMFQDAPFAPLTTARPKFRHKVIGVVFHVAATVRFDETLQLATAINVRSVRDILRLARAMPRLKALLHVSTIYANCVHKSIEERVYPPALDGEQLIQITQNLPAGALERITPDLLGDYPNTYTLTKQVGEGVVLAESTGMPVAIFRPAIAGPLELPVYNYGSTSAQPITWGDFRTASRTFGMQYPTIKCAWYYSFHMYKHYALYYLASLLFHVIPALIVDVLLLCVGKAPRLLKAYKKIHKFTAVMSYFATQEWSIESTAIEKQQLAMSPQDRRLFFCDLKLLDWPEFFQSYCKGIRLYLLLDPLETLPAAQAHLDRLYYAHQVLKGVALWALIWIVWRLLPF
ncbi:hypothetical protein YQE_08436, partial [Dendroctonus ponderosae]